MIYSAGLRGQEVINLKIPDVDFERKVIHIRQSKYKKDRIVPLADSMAVGLKKYLSAENPHVWLFNGKVTFIAKDYRDRAIKKPVTLDGIEFLRRFTMHILPKRFVKIRRYGIYNHTVKRNMALHFTSEKKSSNPKEKKLPPETKQQRFERLTGVNLYLCQACKTGRMITVRELPRIRSPGWSFLSFQNTNS